jgi:hypothetical protein
VVQAPAPAGAKRPNVAARAATSSGPIRSPLDAREVSGLRGAEQLEPRIGQPGVSGPRVRRAEVPLNEAAHLEHVHDPRDAREAQPRELGQ